MFRLRAVIVAALLVLPACSESPTGRTQFAFVPQSIMTDLGQQTFEQLRASQPATADARARALVQCVADEVIAAASGQYPGVAMPADWEIVVFENPSPNAFALPGGRIGVNTGLLRVAENASQLATVMGHEVAHVLAHHGNERLTQQMGLKAILFLVGLFTESDIEQDALVRALGVGAQLGIALPFSRAHEAEADRMGLRIMAAAGFEPGASVALWRNMAERGGEQPPEFLSTHPANESRIQALQAQLSEVKPLAAGAQPAACP